MLKEIALGASLLAAAMLPMKADAVDHKKLCVDAVLKKYKLKLTVDRYENDGSGIVVSGRVPGGKRAGCLFSGDKVTTVHMYD